MTSTTPPSTVRAWQYTSVNGGIEKNMKLNPTQLPKPKPDQHLVQIFYTSLNPVDYKPAEVPYVGRLLVPNPATPGIDFVGRLVAPAAGSSLKAGQLVFGSAGKSPFAAGGLSEYATTEIKSTVALPEGVEPMQGATVGVAGLTAYQSIAPHVRKGDKVFLNGGSGGCGVFGIQIAKALGCHVTVTCSTANVDLCKSIGADEVVDYRKQNVADALKAAGHRFNHIVDNVGGDPTLFYRCHEFSEPDCVFMTIAGTPSLSFFLQSLKMKLWPAFLGGGRRKPMGFFAKADNGQLEKIGNWIKEGAIKPVVDSVFPFEQAPQAFKKLKTGRAKGKIVVEVSPMA